MDRADPSPPWYAPWRHATQPRPADDPADLGTAFGLDLSMGDPAPPAAPAQPSSVGRHAGRWMLRLAARRHSPR